MNGGARAALCGALALLFLGAGETTAGASWREDLARAERLGREGGNAEAAAAADQAAKSCPDSYPNDQAQIMDLAELYADLGYAPRAESAFGRVVAEPRSTMPDGLMRRMALFALARGRFEQAEDLYRQGIRALSDRGETNHEAAMLDDLAAAYEKDRKPREAAEARERGKSLRARP